MTTVIPGGVVKIAVSLPTKTFRRVESARKKLGESRSALYVKALEDYLRAMEVREMERRYEAGYRKRPMTRKELKELEAFMKAGLSGWGKESW
jgi:metal-responsive CopG/Arc/MetJ family transcriptional regulator